MINNQRKSNTERAYARQIQQLESAHTALLEELSFVSARNAEIEPKYKQYQAQYSALSKQYQELQRQNDLVLSMLGEKSEELDAALQDLQDVKDLYRNQLDAALNQLTQRDAPPQPEQAERRQDKA
jgi:chromosome segregation ATPase